MNRRVSAILIPLLLVSQSFVSVPHSHAGTSVDEPIGHAAHPHVHLHDAHHRHMHDEREESRSAPMDDVPDHDSDAVYAGDIQLLNDGKITEVAKAELSTTCIVCSESATAAISRRCTAHQSPPLVRPKCALYLQLLMIRC